MLTHEEIVKDVMPKLKDAYLDDKRGIKLRSLVVKLFESSENPYITGLDLTEKAGDYLQPRSNSLSGTIFKEFHSWFIAWPNDDRRKEALLTDEIRLRAFNVCSERHTHLLAMAADIYKLRDAPPHLTNFFLDSIRFKAKKGFYKEAINCVTILKLQCHFDVNEIAIPCILQDKTYFIESYFDGFPDLQIKLLGILDCLCSPTANIDEFLKFYNINGIRKDKLSFKTLQKLVGRISKQYNIAPEITPNLSINRSQGTLRYLLHRRYTENAMESANFDDMVYQAVETCPHLAGYLLTLFCYVHNNYAEAAKWAIRLKVPGNLWPYGLYDFIRINPGIVANMEKQGYETKTAEDDAQYLTLPFGLNDIIVVDDESKLDFALQCIESSSIVGLDTEWQPSFGQHIEKVAILQISTKEKAFLVDILNLTKNETKLKDFMRRLFCNEKILKLGFQFAGDLKTLGVTLPFCKEIFLELRNISCVGTLIDALKHENLNFMNDFSNVKATAGNEVVNNVEKAETSPAKKECKATNGDLYGPSGDDVIEFVNTNDSLCEEDKEKFEPKPTNIIVPSKFDSDNSIELIDFDEPLDKKEKSYQKQHVPTQIIASKSNEGRRLTDLVEIIKADNEIVASAAAATATATAALAIAAPERSAVKPHCGLSEVCQYFLGKPLNKNEQFSNWARRPLRNSQIRYAALDAFCLIEIFEKVKQRAADLRLDFQKSFSRSLVSGSKVESKQKTKKSPSTRQMERAELMQMIEKLNQAIKVKNQNDIKCPADMKVVADNMLQGLGKHLRRCGIDCFIMENYQPREATIDVARSECRIVLSSGQAFAAIAPRLPPSMSCCVPNMINSKEQLAWFLEKFNVVVTENDIFSRCMQCNCNGFLLIPAPLFKIVWDAVIAPLDLINPVPFDAQDAENRAKTFLNDELNKSQRIRFDENLLTFYIDDYYIDILTAKMYSSANPNSKIEIEIETVPAAKAFESIDLFYVCRKCGKVYWDGSHMKRYVDKVGVVSKN